jgi:hypothetical protein
VSAKKHQGENQVNHHHKHAERPVLVTSEAGMVAMSIITTAPAQNRRSIGVGPMT